MDAEYRASAWLQINNGWDEGQRKPIPMTAQQEQIINKLFQELLASGAELQLTLQQKTSQDANSWPTVARFKVFANAPRDRAPQTGSSGDFQ